MTILAPLLVGLAFGLLLERGGLTRYDRIAGVYQLRDLTVLYFLGSALAVGALAIQAAISLGLVQTLPVTPTHLAANALGGALFGVGMAVAGFCPGTILAGAGTGQLDYLVPGIAGLLAGALAFGWLHPAIGPALARGGQGAITLPDVLGVSGWSVALLLAELALVGFYAAERAVRPVAAPGVGGAAGRIRRPASAT